MNVVFLSLLTAKFEYSIIKYSIINYSMKIKESLIWNIILPQI